MSRDADDFQIMCPEEHYLHRPDMCLGEITNITEKKQIIHDMEDGTVKISNKQVTFNPGIMKILDEILTNATDVAKRPSSMCTLIDVNLNEESGVVTIRNTGVGIPVVTKQVEIKGVVSDEYIPFIVFGVLHSGSNFDDSKDRNVAGRNGLGAKLANLFSSEFQVEVADPINNRKFQMKWRNNMSERDTKPKITHYTNKKGYVHVTFRPELTRFDIESTNDISWKGCCELFKRRMYDCAMTTPSTTRVVFNGVEIGIRNFKDYANMFMTNSNNILYHASSSTCTWDIAVCIRENEEKSLSFVNGIETHDGGTHLEYIKNQLIEGALPFIEKKGNINQSHAKFIKEKMLLCVNATVINPTFSSQAKTKLTTPSRQFKRSVVLTDAFIRKFANSDIIDAATRLTQLHTEKASAAKDAKVNRKSVRGIAKLDDANWAGGKRSDECTLLLAEGDSAKSLLVSGIGVVGRDRFGVFPLKGKLLNTRIASLQDIASNVEISNIKQIMGLEVGKKYNSTKQLRYGKICIAADADVDGIHIKGLVLNFIQSQWPELIDLGLVCTLLTPIVRASRKGFETQNFFTSHDLENWKTRLDLNEEDGPMAKWTLKYYKGLGTSSADEARDIFRAYDSHVYKFQHNDCETGTIEVLDLAFDKKKANERKAWMLDYLETVPSWGDSNNTNSTRVDNIIGIGDFVNSELIQFSVADVQRSIPHLMDGLKTSQRKVIFTCLKRGFYDKHSDNKGIKVVQIAGAVSETSAYHHGDASLQSTIVSLAHSFIGSNQLPLLTGIGQFGTRLQGGKDAASPRYIGAYLSDCCRTLFAPDDNSLLSYLEDEGMSIEPSFYIPVLPLILINGASGIGTGWSSDIPCFELSTIYENTRRLVIDEDAILLPMHVNYKGFTGKTEKVSEQKWKLTGTFKVNSNGNTIEITELPPTVWTNSYKEWLNKQEWIKSIEDYTTEDNVRIVLKLSLSIPCGEIEQKLHLSKMFSTTNMHLFNASGNIQKYDSPEHIIRDWTRERIMWYQQRKELVQSNFEQELVILSNKQRFIQEVISGTLMTRKKKKEMESDLFNKRYDLVSGSFSYLFDLTMHCLTQEYLNHLAEKILSLSQRKAQYETKSNRDIFLDDLSCIQSNLLI